MMRCCFAFLNIYICMYVGMYVYMYVCMYVCIYVCMYVYMCVCILYIHVYLLQSIQDTLIPPFWLMSFVQLDPGLFSHSLG